MLNSLKIDWHGSANPETDIVNNKWPHFIERRLCDPKMSEWGVIRSAVAEKGDER
jgi:hypothetical protein